MPRLVIELPSQEAQTKFNLQRYREIEADPVWERWEGRVETDRHGTVLMSPPPGFPHASYSMAIVELLNSHLTAGRAFTVCPVSTADGVRSPDVIWVSAAHRKKFLAGSVFSRAPEICIEVLSPRNRLREMAEKKALHFGAHAKEVWFCDLKGRMEFFTSPTCTGVSKSKFCPGFPADVPPL